MAFVFPCGQIWSIRKWLHLVFGFRKLCVCMLCVSSGLFGYNCNELSGVCTAVPYETTVGIGLVFG